MNNSELLAILIGAACVLSFALGWYLRSLNRPRVLQSQPRDTAGRFQKIEQP